MGLGLAVRVGGKEYPLSSYADLLHDPTAVEASLAGHPVPPPFLSQAPTVALIHPQPGITEDRQVILEALVTDDYGIQDLEVRQDGKLVPHAAVQAATRQGPGGTRVHSSKSS